MAKSKSGPFIIRSWNDPTHEYELNDYEKFEIIWRPRGFYIASGPHREDVQDRIAEIKANHEASRKQADNANKPTVNVSTDADASDAKQ